MLNLKDLRSRWWFQCALMWLCTFILLNAAGMIGVRVLDLGQGARPNQFFSPYSIPGIWVRWDAGYYLGIAADGYAAHPGSAGFFPFYPMLISVLYRVTGINIFWIGMLISNVAFLFSTLLLYKIARIIKDDHAYAMRSVLSMLIFPTSLFYFALYAESLYLFFALLGVYLILRNRQSFLGGGLALGLASVARPVGWLLDVVMLGEFVKRRKFDAKNLFALAVGSVLSVLGVVIYVYYLYVVLGTFMAIPNAQASWPRQWQFPLITYLLGLKTLIGVSLLRDNWFLYAMNALDLLSTSFAVFIIWISFTRAKNGEFPWSLSVYSIVALLFYLSSQNEMPVPLWGMTRWVASLFPLYFVLGNLFQNRRLQLLFFLGSGMLLIMFTAWWASGRWIG